MTQNILNGLIENKEKQQVTPYVANELIMFLNEQGNLSREDIIRMLENPDGLDGKSKITLLKIIDSEKVRQINFEKLEELSLIKDYDSIEQSLFNDIAKKIINAEDMDISDVNRKIHKIHEIFLTNSLPFNFKLFEFFKHHKNYNINNENLYDDDIKKGIKQSQLIYLRYY